MNVILYQNNSEPNVVDKKLTSIITVTGNLRGKSSVMNPVITIETESANIVWCNYIYIEEWGRYYFVTEITSVRSKLWALSCHVDVLSTYKTNIRKLSGIVARQENLYNLYLDDDKFLVNAQRMYWTKAFPNRVQPASSGGNSLILTLAGGAVSAV